MKENLELAVFLFFVVLAVACGLWPITASIHECWTEAQKDEEKGRGRFDERQRIAQAKAGVHALVTLVVYLIVWAAEGILRDAWSSWKDGRPALGGTVWVTSLIVWQSMFWSKGGVWRVAYVFLWADIVVLLALALFDERRRKRMKNEDGGV